MSCGKVVVFIYSLCSALAGIGIITLGWTMLTKYHKYSDFVGDNIRTAPIVAIIFGVIIFIVGFLGSRGFIIKNPCMIRTFVIFTVIFLIVEIVIGVVGLCQRAELKDILSAHFNKTLEEYNKREEYRDAWKFVQTELNCCGIKGPKDWKHIFGTLLPASCCTELPLNDTCKIEFADEIGCGEKLITFLNENIQTLAFIALAIVIVQLLIVMLICYMPKYQETIWRTFANIKPTRRSLYMGVLEQA